MTELIVQDPEKLETLTADRQGRISLGVKYADRQVKVVVINSEEAQPEKAGVQEAIGDQPMQYYERQGMLFIRTFGISPTFLEEDHDAETDENGIDPETVSPSDVDWSEGFLVDAKNVARFHFDTDAEERQFAFSDRLTEEPASVRENEDDYGEPVYCYVNEKGDESAILKEFVENIRQIFGYSYDELSHIRVDPDEGPNPVMFRDPNGHSYIAIGPRRPSS